MFKFPYLGRYISIFKNSSLTIYRKKGKFDFEKKKFMSTQDTRL